MRMPVVSLILTFAAATAAHAQDAPAPAAPAAPAPTISSAPRPGFPTIIGGNDGLRIYNRSAARDLPGAYRPGFGPADRFFASSRRYQDNYQQTQQYGRCAASISGDRARDVLATVPNTRTELVELRQLTGVARGCLSFGFGAPVIFLRGGLAEAMYNRLPVGSLPSTEVLTPANVSAFSASSQRINSARLPDDRLLSQLADCLVLQAPASVDALLRSRHGSAPELAALNDVLARSPGCSDRATFPAAGGRPFLRSYLAESAYRLANFRPAGRVPLG